MSSLTQPCTECTDIFDCPLHQTPEPRHTRSDEFCPHCDHCDPQAHYTHSGCSYIDVYDLPEELLHSRVHHTLEDEEEKDPEELFFG